MKEAVKKVIDTLTQEDFHGVFQKLLERYNKCIAARGDYFEGDESFMCVLSIKVPIRKKSGNLFNDPCIRYIGFGLVGFYGISTLVGYLMPSLKLITNSSCEFFISVLADSLSLVSK